MSRTNHPKRGLTTTRMTNPLRPMAVAVALTLAPAAALANPTGPTVVNGQVSFHQAGNLLSITNSPNAIINWQSFSIGANEVTRFLQQSAASAVLNRVVGAGGAIDPSVILGALQSNGRVFLLNPSGIVFGAGAQVDVAGLVASSLNLSNADFLGGRLRFTEVPGAGAVVNQGAIHAAGGAVYLVGPSVTNQGVITTPGGEVVLAAGRSVELVEPGTPQLRVEVSAPEHEARNLGSIVVDSGRVGIYAGLINHSGTIRADSAVLEGGRVVLKATRNATLEAGSVISARGTTGGRIEVSAGDTTLVAGTVDAKGSAADGGIVHLLGDKVGIYGDARVDVSGASGGGTVLAGGDFQGRAGVTAVEGAPIRNATATFFGSDATIAADAVVSGDGGKVIVWADHTTRSHGTIRARGGAAFGNGGLVETSGKVTLEVTRGPDVRAPNGLGGTWLLDPTDFEIVAGSLITNNTAQPMFSTLAESSKVGVDLINLQLDAGSNVVLTTASQGPLDGAQPGNITISAPIVKSASTTPDLVIGTTSLTVQAHNNIVINPGGGVVSTGDPLDVTLSANAFAGTGLGGVSVNGAILTNGGSANLSGRGNVDVNAAVSTVRTAGAGGGEGGGSLFLNSSAGAVNIGAMMLSGSSFSASGFTGVNVNGAVTAPNNVGVSFTSATGPVNINQPVAGGFFTATSSGAGSMLVLAAPVSAAFGSTLTADDMAITGTLTTGGSLTVRQSSPGRPMNLGSETAGALSLTQAELANLVTTGSVTYGNSSTGAFTVSAPVAPGSTSVAMNSGASFTVSPGASLTTAVPLAVNAPAVTLGGPVSAQSVTITTDNIAANAAVTSAGDVNLFTRSYFRPINLGAATDSGTALDVSAAELNNFVTGASGALRVGTTSSGPVTIVESIAPSGTQTLSLRSGGGITQNQGKTIAIQNLALQASDTVHLPEDNVVSVLSAALCCSGDAFTFTNAPATPLTLGNVDGMGGVYNSYEWATAALRADRLDATHFMYFDKISIAPRSPGVKLDLGGADGVGVMGISAGDAAQFSGTTLQFAFDRVDVTAPVSFNSYIVELAPLTAGRAINVIPDAAAKNPANLELKPMELAMVSAASTLTLGDAVNSGPLTVAPGAAVDVTGSISFLTLRTGDPAGLVIDAPVTGNSVALIADAMAINQNVTATAANGSLMVVPNLGGTQIDLGGGGGPGVLGIDTAEVARLRAPNGALFVGNSITGSVDITDAVTFSNVAALNITSGARIEVHPVNGVAPHLETPGSISLSAPEVTISSPVTSTVSGNIRIAANALTISAPVTTTGSGIDVINVMPYSFQNLTLGGVGGAWLNNNELNQLRPSSGLVRVGDFSNTGNIQIVGPIDVTGGEGIGTLSLIAGNGGVTQSTGATITVPNLAVRAAGAINLQDNNNVSGSVAINTDFGAIDFKHAGTNPLTIGTVDGVTGVYNFCCFGQPITLRSDDINVQSPIAAAFGSNNVVLLPVNAARPVTIGSQPGGTYGLVQSEIDLIQADTIFVGNSTTGSITVASPVSFPSSVSLTTAPANAINVNGSLSAWGNVTFSTGTLTTSAPVTSNAGSITATADAMNLGATVNAAGSITLLTRAGASTSIELGGAGTDGPGTLVLNAAELDNLSYGGLLTIGSAAADDLSVVSTVSLPGNVTLATGAQAEFLSGTFSAGGNLTVVADSISIPGVAGLAASGDVVLMPRTAGLAVTLGTGAGLNLPFAATLNKISTNTGTLVVDTSGALAVAETLPFDSALVSNVRLSGGTLTVSNPVSAAGDIALRGNTMDIQSPVASTGGGVISASRRTLGAMTVGAPGSTLTAAAVGNLGTSGALRLGETGTASTLTVNAPLNASAFGSLTLAANGTISQTAGSTITAPQLRLQGNGTINLPEANSVQTLAGGNTGSSYTFSAAGTVTVGPTVDGVAGLQGGALNFRADDLNLVGPGVIGNFSATLGPRIAGTAIDLGGNAPGAFSVDAAGLANISSFTLNFGNNTAGPVTVSAPMQRVSGTLGILTAPTQTVNVNGPLAAPSGVTIDAGTINVNQAVDSTFGSVNLTARAPATLTVNAPVTAGSSVALNSDSTAINAPITANPSFGTVTIAPVTANRPVSLGVETSGALSLTQSELALVDAPNLTLGSFSSGQVSIGAPLALNVNTLNLRSGAAIVQGPGAPVLLTRTTTSGVRVGNLDVRSGVGHVDMRAANELPGSLIVDTGGTGNDFDFVNALPMKLQSISNFGVSGKTRINAGLFSLLPSALELGEGGPDLQAVLVAAIDQISKINDTLDAADAEEKKKGQEEQKKRQTCD